MISVSIPGSCPYCSTPNNQVIHLGPCTRVKAIEYHPDGSLKRVEFHENAPNPVTQVFC